MLESPGELANVGQTQAAGWLARNRRRIDQDVRGLARRHLTAAFMAQYDATKSALERFVRGHVIDLGAGESPFAEIVRPQSTRYDTLDTSCDRQAVTFVADIQNMPEVDSEQYDTALCLQVLEHVPEPAAALRECSRVLRPGGMLILSVPHLSRLHDEPHDYYRYTCHGLAHLAAQAGFVVQEMHPYGSVCSFLGHQLSTLVLLVVWGIPGLREAARIMNCLLLVWPCWLLDRTPFVNRFAPLGYLAVFAKLDTPATD